MIGNWIAAGAIILVVVVAVVAVGVLTYPRHSMEQRPKRRKR